MVNDTKKHYVLKIEGTAYIVNAFSSENAKKTQEELVKNLILREAMALTEDEVA